MQPLSLKNQGYSNLAASTGGIYGANAGPPAKSAALSSVSTVPSSSFAMNQGSDLSSLLVPLLSLISQVLKLVLSGQGQPATPSEEKNAGNPNNSNGTVTPTPASGTPSVTNPGQEENPAEYPASNLNQSDSPVAPTKGTDNTLGENVQGMDPVKNDDTAAGTNAPGSIPEATNGGYGSNIPDPATPAQPGTEPNTDVPQKGVGDAATMSINERRNLNYSDLKADPNGGSDYQNVRAGKQAFNGVSGQEAAIMHLGGRGHISASETANGVSGTVKIYNNVLNDNPKNTFTPDEKKLIEQYAADEKAQYGYITGENLDRAFIDQMAQRGAITPDRVAVYNQAVTERVAKMVNNPDQAAVAKEASQEVNFTSDIPTLEKQSGLNKYEQAVYRLVGHSPLFSGDGTVNGDVLPITLNNKKSLDGRDMAGQDTNIDDETLQLLQTDLASDGQLNGDSLKFANQQVLDKIYLRGPGATNQAAQQNAIQQAQAKGRSPQEVMKSLQTSANDALKQFGDFVNKHPVISATGAAALGAGAAVCPYFAGTIAVGAGIAAGTKAMNTEAKPTA